MKQLKAITSLNSIEEEERDSVDNRSPICAFPNNV